MGNRSSLSTEGVKPLEGETHSPAREQRREQRRKLRVERLRACHGIASTSLGEVTQECGSLAMQTLSEVLPPLRYSFPLPDS